MTADVENGAAWERGPDNHVVMCTEVDDVSTYMSFVQDPATQEAMKHDGVKRDTVKLFVLDKHFPD